MKMTSPLDPDNTTLDAPAFSDFLGAGFHLKALQSCRVTRSGRDALFCLVHGGSHARHYYFLWLRPLPLSCPDAEETYEAFQLRRYWDICTGCVCWPSIRLS